MPELTTAQRIAGLNKLGIELPPEATDTMLKADSDARLTETTRINQRREQIRKDAKAAGIIA
jgi:hypothetical protein